MRFVDGKQCNARPSHHVEKTVREQPFGRHVKKIQRAAQGCAAGLRRLASTQARVQRPGSYAELLKRSDLILHECDQGRNHDGEPVAQQCRQLIAKRFSAPCGHQYQGISALGHMPYDLGLTAAKRRVAEGLAKPL
jgi:hypothetical protein